MLVVLLLVSITLIQYVIGQEAQTSSRVLLEKWSGSGDENMPIIRRESINVLYSDTLPGNLLPNFMFQQGSIEGGSVGVKLGGGRGSPRPFVPDDSCGDDIFDHAMIDMRSPQLPYLTQDQWTCDRTPTDLPVWVLENKDLKVTVTPQFAGKVWGIFDKNKEKELLFANRAHQPANIGALKSWAAGGAEWNWSPGIIGHSAFSETQVHTALVDTPRGPMIRVFEFDRYNGTVWQVDMFIANGSFLAHPKITNPTDCDLNGYWWTCVAVPATPSTRILTPATHVAETSRDPMRNAPWPVFAEAIENASFTGYKGAWGTDNSFLGNHQIGDMFLRIPDTVYTPYIGHTEADGYVLVHGHPLNGTKFYTWGQSGPGRFMQDFLAGGGKRQGDYTELQVGPAPTQMQTFPVPKRSIRQWTEWFKPFQADPSVHSGPYKEALAQVDTWMRSESGVPQSTVKDWDRFFEAQSTTEPSAILSQGTPWGALEEMRLGHQLAPGLTFTLPQTGSAAYIEVAPWIELLQRGTFSEESMSAMPLSYQTTDAWMKLIQNSADKFGLSWLHALHLAIGHMERGAIALPASLLHKSMELKPNPIAARCLAVLTPLGGGAEEAWPWFTQAWSLTQSMSESTDPDVQAVYTRLSRNLVTEMSFFLQQNFQDAVSADVASQWRDRAEGFASQVPSAFQGLDAFITLQVRLFYSASPARYDDGLKLLASNCFPTYAKARDDLMLLWNQGQEGKALLRKIDTGDFSPLSALEAHKARMATPIPDNIGCQYASEYCLNYW